MCKICEINPVYEFTNKRKLCERCFINYFNKKFILNIKKFNLISKGDKIYYVNNKDFKTIVLKNILHFFKSKFEIEIFEINNKDELINIIKKNKKSKIKLALNSSIDFESEEFFTKLVYNKIKKLDSFLPSFENKIKPLYPFLDEEIFLYGKLNHFFSKQIIFDNNNNGINKNNIHLFLNYLEKSHPEVKRAVINSLLKLGNKKDMNL